MNLPKGFLTSGMHCGIKRKKLDLGLIYAKDYCKVAGFFTTNANPSYSVILSKRNINNPIKAILTNSGNANCYSHERGLKDTEEIISQLAAFLGVRKSNILIASTGIIGKKLPKNRIIKSFPKLIKNLSRNYHNFSRSILTTDTFRKVSYAKMSFGSKTVNILGFAKGAGMIYPNMATMLSFVLTDIDLPGGVLKKICREAVAKSFNSISVDGCMSTNDTVFFILSRKVRLTGKKSIAAFSRKLKELCLNLAKLIIKDAEGATKFIQITVKGAKTQPQAKRAALALANSALFKCALYGANSNWGRIISALGQAKIKVGQNIKIKSSSLKKSKVKMTVDLKRGKYFWTVYTSDFTPEYVKINAQYT